VHVQREVPEEIDELAVAAVNGTVHLPAAIAEGFGMSRSDARRVLAQGGVRLDGEPLAPEDLDLPRERLDGAVLQVGKRHFRRLRVS
jgi:tyrosyl-tRNA synthetase